MNEGDTGGPSELMLATIQPGNSSESIIVDSKEVSLQLQHQYSCISYISSGKTEEVRFDGETRSVDSALASALRAIRKPDVQSTLWAEGLTDIASDTTPSSTSTIILKTAYSNAEEVLLWLGRSDSHTEKAIETLKQFASQWRIFAEASRLPDNWSQANPRHLIAMIQSVKQAIDTKALEFPDLENPAVVESMNALVNASYLRHVTAISSIVLAKKAVAMVGNATISWEDYADSMNLIAVTGGLLTIMCDVEYVQILTSIRVAVRRWREDSNSLELLPMLQGSRETECQDPRDRVFSILPIISPSRRVRLGQGVPQDSIKIDYSASQQQVFTDAARYIVGERQDLLLWNNVPSPSKPSRLQGLPSWAPDWSDSSAASALQLRRSMALRSWELSLCVQANHKPLEVTASGILKAQAHIISKVASVSPEVYTEINLDVLMLANLQLLPPTESLRHADDYWRCLILDQGVTGKPPPSSMRRSWISVAAKYAVLKALGITPIQFAADPSLVAQAAATNTDPVIKHLFRLAANVNSEVFGQLLKQALGRRFFTTEAGLIGMGFHEEDGWDGEHRIRAGDVVAVFVGGYFPYILRECGRGEDGIVRYRLIGEAHVQGLMEAEVLKDRGWIFNTWKVVEVQDVEIV